MSSEKARGIQTFLVQAISWILGSSVILFGITTFYNDFINKPQVDVEIITSKKDFPNATIRVTNSGMKPATNLVLTINAPGNIIDSPRIVNTQNFTTENLTKNSMFQLSTPRLVHGSGSVIEIDVSSSPSNSDLTNGIYTVYATYGEGSTLTTKKEIPTFEEQIFGPWFDSLTAIAYLDAIAAVSIIIFTIPYAQRISYNRRIREQAGYLSKVLEDIMMIQRTLQQDLTYKDKVPENWNSMSNDLRRVLADHIHDYLVIHKFYTEVNIRNLEISNKELEETKRLNQRCIELAENTLKRVDWKKYKALSYGISTKSPFIASIMAVLGGAIFLSGIGHIYVERLRRGVILLIFSTIIRVVTIIATFIIVEILRVEQIEFTGPLDIFNKPIAVLDDVPAVLLSLLLFLTYVVIWIWHVFDAKKLAERFNIDVEKSATKVKFGKCWKE